MIAPSDRYAHCSRSTTRRIHRTGTTGGATIDAARRRVNTSLGIVSEPSNDSECDNNLSTRDPHPDRRVRAAGRVAAQWIDAYRDVVANRRKRTIEVLGDGKQRKSYLHVADGVAGSDP